MSASLSTRIKGPSRTVFSKLQSGTMKIHPSLLYSCSSIALWRAVTAFTPAIAAAPGQANVRAFATTALMASKMDQSFPTWSFDKPCQSMEWNSLVETTLSIASADKAAVEDADLVIIGVYAPAKDDTDDDEEEKEEEEPTVTLSGIAKEIDDSLGGAISELMLDNAKAFKHGASAGTTTPTARVISANGKVRQSWKKVTNKFFACD